MGTRKGSWHRWSLTVMTLVLCWVLFGGISSSFAASTISGHVYENDNATPIPNLNVFVTDYDTGQWIAGTGTDALGSYAIGGLSAGRYRVNACASCSRLLYADEYYPDTRNYGSAEPVPVDGAETRGNIDFSLMAAVSVSGRVTDGSGQGISMIPMQLWLGRCWQGNLPGAGTDNDGNYFLTVPLGEQVFIRTCAACAGQNLIDQWWNGAGGTTDCNAAIPLVATQNFNDINIVLAPGSSISGYVFRSDGATPIPNLWVHTFVNPTNQWMGGAYTGPDGRYTIAGLPAGNYQVSTCAVCNQLPYVDQHNFSVDTIVGQTNNGINFSLESGASISGTVRDGSGNPITGKSIGLTVFTGDPCGSNQVGPGAGSNPSDGTYTIQGIVPGTYYLRSSNNGDANFTNEWRSEAGSSLDCSDAQAITLGPGDAISGKDLHLDPGGWVTGRVTGMDGVTGIANLHVSVNNPAGVWIAGTNTDQNGDYMIPGVPTGSWKVMACASCSGLLYINEFFNNTTAINNAQPVNVVAGQTTENIDFSLEPPGIISGTVTQVDGTPISNVYIGLSDYDTGYGRPGATTDAQGRYSISLPAGRYRVSACASCNGVPYVDELYNDKIFHHEADPVTVIAGQQTSGIDFSLSPAVSVTGRVTDDQNQPIAGMRVHAFSEKCGPNAILGTDTDSDGYYTLFVPPIGQAYIQTCPGCVQMNYVFEWWNDATGTSDCNAAVPVDANMGQAQTGINFSLESGASISGAVRDGSGNPIIGKSIGLTVFTGDPCGFNQVGPGTGSNPSDGTYTIQSIPSGTYYLRSSNNGDANFTNEWLSASGSSLDCRDAQAITLGPGDAISGKDLQLEPGGWIRGRVTGIDGVTGIANIHVSANDQQGVWIAGSNTDQNGNYLIPGVPSGSWKVMACASCNGLLFINEFYNNTTDINSAQPVNVIAGQTTENINFSLEPPGTISGTVKKMDGTPLANVNVGVSDYDTGIGWGSAMTDAQGNYAITGVPAGSYRVHACSSCNGMPYVNEFFDDTFLYHEAQAVTVNAGQPTTGVNFSLEPGVAVSGTVTQVDDTAIPNVNIGVSDYESGYGMGGAMTDANGHYSIILPAGRYRIHACATCSGMPYVNEFFDNSLFHHEAEIVTVIAGQPVSDINFSLEIGGSISGVVKSAGGVPITGVSINVSVITGDRCGQNQGVVGTNSNPSDGTYTILGIPEGTYYLRTWNNNANYVNEWWNGTGSSPECGQAQTVSVAPGVPIAGRDFYLDLGGMISGRVTQADGSTGIGNLHVFATDYGSNQWLGGTNTGPDGGYSIVGLPAGSYRVRACTICSGLPFSDEFYDKTPDYNRARAVAVATGQTTSGINFSLFVDSDHDNLPDDWEILRLGDLAQSGGGDRDGDGLTNLQEYQYGTHPNNPDTDGDRFNDRYEVNAGTDPNEPASMPPLPITGAVTNIRQSDGTYQAVIEVWVGNEFLGDLANDIDSITITGPGISLTKQDLQYLPQFRDFYMLLPGSPPVGRYDFLVSSGALTGNSFDYQGDHKEIPIPDKNTFLPATGAVIQTKTPFFSWAPVESSDAAIYYRFEVTDMAENRVFASDHRPNMTYFTLPAEVLIPGQTYKWRVRAVDHFNYTMIDNQANSEWLTFTMDGTLAHDAMPALELTWGWGAVTWTTSGGTGVVVTCNVVDHDGISYNGSSHQVFVSAPDGTEYPMSFDGPSSAIRGSYSTYINSVVPGEYTMRATDPAGNIGTLIDDLSSNPLPAFEESSFTPSGVAESVQASFDNVYVDDALYDTFDTYNSIGELDPQKWQSPLNVAIQDQRLKFAVGGTVGRGDASLRFANAARIQSTKADITIDAASSGNCRARIYWDSTFNGIPNLGVQIMVGLNGVGYVVSENFLDYGTLSWRNLAGGSLLENVNLGERITVSISWDEPGKTLTFTANDNSAQYTFPEGKYPNFLSKYLQTRTNLTTDDTTPTFAWNAVPGANRYRVRIYSYDNKSLWTGEAGGSTTYQVPPGALKPDAMYRYRMEAFDSPYPLEPDNASKAPASNNNYYTFYTGSMEDPNPFIDLDSHGAMTWRDDVNGTSLVCWIKIHDAQGVPENIQSVTVTPPGGSPIPLTFDVDNFYRANTRTCGGYSLTLVSESPVAGIYTFTVTDKDGNQHTIEEELNPDPIGYPNRSSLITAIHGTAVDFDWEDVTSILPGQGRYQLEIYENGPRRVYTFSTTESQFHLAEGFLKEGETYRWRITTRREFFGQNVDNVSASPASYDDMPYIRLATIKGDVNSDGSVDMMDAVLALKALSGFPEGVNLSADVDGDGKIGISEVGYILQAISGTRNIE